MTHVAQLSDAFDLIILLYYLSVISIKLDILFYFTIFYELFDYIILILYMSVLIAVTAAMILQKAVYSNSLGGVQRLGGMGLLAKSVARVGYNPTAPGDECISFHVHFHKPKLIQYLLL